MVATIIISIITVIAMICSILFFPSITIKGKKIQTFWIITLLGAIIIIATKNLDLSVFASKVIESSSINPLKIIILFFSMTFLSCYLDELGFFKFLAIEATNKAKSSQFSIFTIFYFLISILTVFTSNDIIILTFTPFICYFCKQCKIDPIPYLISEFIAANTLSMALLIGNPTNIYLALSANITFFDYFKEMFLRSIIICIITYGLLLLIFKNKLKVKMEKEFIETRLHNKLCIYVGLVDLILCIVGMVISSYVHIDMYIISASFAIFIVLFTGSYELVVHKNKHMLIHTFKKLPYALIPFLFSMFAIVTSLEQSGLVEILANKLSSKNEILTIGYSSFFACSVLNNIPMSVLYSSILNSGVFTTKAIYSAIVGSNLGALFTPIGALAGIMFISIVNDSDTKMTFTQFIKYGMPISLFLITITLLSLFI